MRYNDQESKGIMKHKIQIHQLLTRRHHCKTHFITYNHDH